MDLILVLSLSSVVVTMAVCGFLLMPQRGSRRGSVRLCGRLAVRDDAVSLNEEHRYEDDYDLSAS